MIFFFYPEMQWFLHVMSGIDSLCQLSECLPSWQAINPWKASVTLVIDDARWTRGVSLACASAGLVSIYGPGRKLGILQAFSLFSEGVEWNGFCPQGTWSGRYEEDNFFASFWNRWLPLSQLVSIFCREPDCRVLCNDVFVFCLHVLLRKKSKWNVTAADNIYLLVFCVW